MRITEKNTKCLPVVERLCTLCGETRWAGTPCALVRLGGCDLECSWCDTRRAQSGGEQISVDELAAWVDGTGLDLVLLTGGEPLLHRALPGLATALARRHRVLVETSGAHDITALPPPIMRSVDVKCPGSGQVHRNLWTNLAQLRAGDAVKMVLTGREDYEFARDVIRDHGLGHPLNILLSCAYPRLEPGLLARWMLEDRLAEAQLNVQLHRYFWPALEEPGAHAAGPPPQPDPSATNRGNDVDEQT